jgi:hypothetical protein
MELNAFPDYLERLREERKTDRELDLDIKLQRIAEKHQETLAAEIEAPIPGGAEEFTIGN